MVPEAWAGSTLLPELLIRLLGVEIGITMHDRFGRSCRVMELRSSMVKDVSTGRLTTWFQWSCPSHGWLSSVAWWIPPPRPLCPKCESSETRTKFLALLDVT